MTSTEIMNVIAMAAILLDHFKNYREQKPLTAGKSYQVRWLPLLCLAALLASLVQQAWSLQFHQLATKLTTRMTSGAFGRFYRGEKIPQSAPIAGEGAYSWVGNDGFLAIAHGLGPQIFSGANQIETLQEGTKRGFRVFEVDLAVTADDHLICFHGDSEADLDRMSYVDYVEIVHRQHLETCEFRDLVRIVSRDPEIRVVLDVKNRFERAYQIARREIGDPALGKSFIPQIYRFDQLLSFRTDRFFAGEIFTSYRSNLSNEEIFDSAQRLDIKVVTLTRERISGLRAMPKDMRIFTHPVDDAFDGAQLRASGVQGIYTSYLTPRTVPELFESWPAGCVPLETWANCRFAGMH